MLRRMLITTAVAVLTGLLVLLWAWRLWTGPGPQTPPPEVKDQRQATLLFRVAPGQTLSEVADSLGQRGFLDHPEVLRLGARLTGRDRDIKAGLFELRWGASPRDILDTLTRGAAVQVKVTIPEGLDAGEIAAIMGRELGFSPGEFLAAADSLVAAAAAEGDLLGSDGDGAERLDALLRSESSLHPRRFHWCEGYLAPDTFLFAEGTDAASAARFLVETQRARLDSVLAAGTVPAVADLSPHDVLTLASIVEAEARIPDERKRIAAVYVNRLELGRRLEADPTVAFILLKKGKRLFYRDLEVASPFNTYRNKGLPPAPIGSPGTAALEAAARPDTTCRALFFVSDGKGGHVFSETVQEHEAAVREFRRVRASGN